MTDKIDFGPLVGQLKGVLTEGLAAALDIIKEDSQKLAEGIAVDLVDAMAAGDTALSEELEAQLKAQALISAKKLTLRKWQAVRGVLTTAFGFLNVGLQAVAGNIPAAVASVAAMVSPEQQLELPLEAPKKKGKS